MATAAKINCKNIDYFKFKKIVIDGNRDDYGNCSKEVKSLCDSVQTLSFRDEEFDDVTDRVRFDEIITYYRQILSSKRIDPTDLRVKNGWWLETNSGNVCSAGKFKPAALKETLVTKTRDWISRHGATSDLKPENISEKLDGPGLYIFKHKERQCFQYVGKADKMFTRCAEKLKAAFDGTLNEPLGALMVISMASDWDFYFIPVKPTDGPDILRILENDVVLKHDSIWPHGLNFSLHIDSLLEVSEFRKSCLRHHWPPETDAVDEPEINLERLRRTESSRGACDESREESDALKTKLENGNQDFVDSHSPSDLVPRLPIATEKTSTENGGTGERSQRQGKTSEQSEPSNRKTGLVSISTKQTVNAGNSTKNPTRPSSAPKFPPPKHSANHPKPSAVSKENAKKVDSLHRSVDNDSGRTQPTANSIQNRLERPRSSLDGRRATLQKELSNQHRITSGSVTDRGMTRSKSVTSTTSFEPPRKEKSKEAVKASGIKAPVVQTTSARRPPTAKNKVPDTPQESINS